MSSNELEILEPDEVEVMELSPLETLPLDMIAHDIREMIIERAAQFGGPMASNLGTVEIILALCRVFNFEKDRIVFDIGQQYQPYKILTGRKDTFFSLGKKGGLTRYPSIHESSFDHFTTGHSGTSVSAALGYAVNNPGSKAVAFLGDGSLTSGEIYEGLNHAGDLKANILVVLNQNNWSIDENVGALSDGTTLRAFAESLKFTYFGPYDGHDAEALADRLEKIKEIKTPVFMHINTIKGKGYRPAEENPSVFHHVFVPFNRETGELAAPEQRWFHDAMNLLEAFSGRCIEYLTLYPDIYFTSPAYMMGGLKAVKQTCPDRVIDTGINEQHCMTFSSALRLAGSKVIMNIASFFIPRCYDQIFDLCIQNIPLVVFICFPGIRASSCPTHQAYFDISALRTIPNMTLVHPMGPDELVKMMDWAVTRDQGPVFIHAATENCVPERETSLNTGKGEFLCRGKDVTIVPVGSLFRAAFHIKETFADTGVEIFYPRFLIPFDYESLLKSVRKTGRLIVLEEGVKEGGVGEGILSVLKENQIKCKAQIICPPSAFIDSAEWDEVYHDSGMTHTDLIDAFKKFMRT